MSSGKRKKGYGKHAARLISLAQRWLEQKTPEKAERIGTKLGRLAYRVSKKHRERALINLRLAFPEWTEAKREEVAQGVLEHFGRVMVDMVRIKKRTTEDVLGTATIEGKENVDAALAAGKGAIFVSAHFGVWERMAHVITCLGFPVSVVVRDADDPDLNAIMEDLRGSTGAKVISRGDAARPILTALKRNETVGLLPDQNSEEIFVPFFGHPCGTVTGPAIISQRSGAPIIPIYGWRTGPNRYHYYFGAPLEPEEGFEPVEGMTRTINKSLEDAIRRAPEQYLWIHNRWKSARRRGLVP